jgi:hypothetical protein
LPANLVTPTNYDLTIRAFFEAYAPAGSTIDPSTEVYDGIVIIDLSLNNATNFILIHADKQLKIKNSTLSLTNTDTSSNLIVTSLTYLPNQLVSINLAQTYQAGKHRLTIEFSNDFGSLTKATGFYRGRYQEDSMIKYKCLSNIF